MKKVVLPDVMEFLQKKGVVSRLQTWNSTQVLMFFNEYKKEIEILLNQEK